MGLGAGGARLAGAVVRHTADGLRPAPPEILAARRALCDACPERDPEPDTCRQCGCSLGGTALLPAKIGWASERCPLGKWERA